MNRKLAATSFLQLVAARRIGEAYDSYIAADFIHHNQYFKGDRRSLMEAMEEAAGKNPDKVLDVKQVFEDGDSVVTHSLVKQNAGDIGAVVVHIFKFEGDKVIELWDIGQALIPDSPNELGPF